MRRHLTPSLVISLIALFVALGGASYAAVKIPKNSVGTSQLKKNAVNSSKVRDRSLLAEDFKAGQLPRGEQGPRGETGARGETGSTGPAGPTFSFAYSVTEPGTGTTVATSGTEVVNRTIAIPRSGRLIVNFTGRFSLDSSAAPTDQAQANCIAFKDSTQLSRFQMSSAASRTTNPSFFDSFVGAQVALTFGYDVPAAGNYTFTILCYNVQRLNSPGLIFVNHDITGVLTGS